MMPVFSMVSLHTKLLCDNYVQYQFFGFHLRDLWNDLVDDSTVTTVTDSPSVQEETRKIGQLSINILY